MALISISTFYCFLLLNLHKYAQVWNFECTWIIILALNAGRKETEKKILCYVMQIRKNICNLMAD